MDKETDSFLIAILRLHCMQRGKNQASPMIKALVYIIWASSPWQLTAEVY